MQIDGMHFDPWAAVAGGALIGLAAVAFTLFLGRIAGISGIVAGLLRPQKGDIAWRLVFVAGLVAAPLAYSLAAPVPALKVEAGAALLAAAGLLVGIGTRYGAGCTSGHGVCGLSRLSPRSLAATLAFMTAGFVTVYLVRHVLI